MVFFCLLEHVGVDVWNGFLIENIFIGKQMAQIIITVVSLLLAATAGA